MSTHYYAEFPKPNRSKAGLSYDGRAFSELKKEHETTLQALICAAKTLCQRKRSRLAAAADPLQPGEVFSHDRLGDRRHRPRDTDSARCDPFSEQQPA